MFSRYLTIMLTLAFANTGFAFTSLAETSTAANEAIHELLPISTRLLVRIPNAKTFDNDLTNSHLANLINRGEFQELQDEFARLSSNGKARNSPDSFLKQVLIGVSWDEIKSFTSGSFNFAVVEHQGALTRVISVDVTGSQNQARDWLDRYKAELGRSGYETEVLNRDNLSISQFVHPATKQKRLVAFADDTLLITENAKLLLQIISPKNRQSTLSDDQSYKNIARQLSNANLDRSQLTWWYNLRPTQGIAKDESLNKQLQSLNDLGFGAFQSLGGTVQLNSDRYEFMANTFVDQPDPLAKAARMLALRNQPVGANAYVKRADLGSVTQINIDWSKAIEGYGTWFDTKYGECEEGIFELVLDEIRDEPDSPRVDVRKSVIANLGGPVTIIRGKKRSDKSTPRAFVVPVANEQAVGEAIGKMLVGDPDAEKKSVNGKTVWRFRDLKSDPDSPLLGPDVSGWAITVQNGHLVVANDLLIIQQLETSAGSSDILESVREHATKLGFERNAAWQQFRIESSVEEGYNRLRDSKPNSSSPFQRFLKTVLPDHRAPDFSKLKPIAKFSEELGWGHSLVKTTDHGWQIVTFSIAH